MTNVVNISISQRLGSYFFPLVTQHFGVIYNKHILFSKDSTWGTVKQCQFLETKLFLFVPLSYIVLFLTSLLLLEKYNYG